MIVRELLTKLGFQVNDQKLKKYEQSTNNIKRSANDAANAFRGMFAAFVGFQGLQTLANTADTVQSLEARIGMLPQTVGDAGAAFDDVASRATAARSSLEAYAGLYIKLQNAGKEYIKTQEEGLQITDTMSKALVVGGATASEQASAILQFGQAIGSGVLQGEELKAMAEASPMFLDELAKAMNIPRESLKKMASQGVLTTKAVIDGVKKMSSVFDARFKTMPITIGQATTIVGNRWSLFIAKLNRKSGTVTKVADFLIKGFDKVESGLDTLIEKLGGAKQAVKLFGIVLAAALAPLVAGGLVSALGWLLSPAGLLIAGLILLGILIEDVWTYMKGGESVTGRLVEWFNGASDGAKVLKGALVVLAIPFVVLGILAKELISFLGLLWTKWDDVFTKVKDMMAGLDLFNPIVVSIYHIFWLLNTMYDIFKSTFDFMKSLANITWDDIGNGFSKMVDKMKEKWDFLKWGLALNPIGAVGVGIGQMVPSSSTNSTSSQNVTINQEYSKDTPLSMMNNARVKTIEAVNEANKQARQMGQAQ